MMTDMTSTAKKCPRQRIYTMAGKVKILCNPLPLPKDNIYQTVRDNPEFFVRKTVTIQDCEACQNKKLPELHEQIQIYAKVVRECPRRRIHNTDKGPQVYCNPMPVPEGISEKELSYNQKLYQQRVVTVEECEACLDKKLPSLRKRLLNYTKAVYRWTKAGGKERPDEEVERIWNICKQCDEHVDGVCQACGCLISKDGKPLRNKLKMDTSHCIKGLW